MLDSRFPKAIGVQAPVASSSDNLVRQRAAMPGRLPTLVTRAQLRQMLGGPQAAPEGCTEEVGDDLYLVRLQLEPGDVLYAEGAKAAYAYIVESGLIQCERTVDDHSPEAVSYAASHDLLGSPGPFRQRRESACAITRTTLLAMSADDLHDMAEKSPLLAELIARPMGRALMRDWRTVYRLRDLPPYARTVAGLSHLIRLAMPGRDPAESPSRLQVVIEVSSLCRWLGLSADELDKSLEQLQRYGALTRQNERITALVPEVMLQVSSALRPRRKEVPDQQERSATGLALVGALLAITASLFLSTGVEAALSAVRQGGASAAGSTGHEVPWGFVIFSSLILVANHLRIKRR